MQYQFKFSFYINRSLPVTVTYSYNFFALAQLILTSQLQFLRTSPTYLNIPLFPYSNQCSEVQKLEPFAATEVQLYSE